MPGLRRPADPARRHRTGRGAPAVRGDGAPHTAHRAGQPDRRTGASSRPGSRGTP
ncbi:hypothetical protein Ae356Ps1_0308c [Pseudonocardia sp. Ae356_Ps1]|nr:hypothetical protein Ae356Ps1_0308c [Pseudonocardia sp. Ae356_Ps1]